MDETTLRELDAWAQQVVTLEPGTRKEIMATLTKLADNPQLDKADRDFAQAQVDAIRRAVRRTNTTKKKS